MEVVAPGEKKKDGSKKHVHVLVLSLLTLPDTRNGVAVFEGFAMLRPVSCKYVRITHRLVKIPLDTTFNREAISKEICNFLDTFAKWRKSTISFVMSVRPSFRMEKLGSHWTDFHEIWYLSIFQKSAEQIQVSLKSDKNKEVQYTFFDHISLNPS